MRFLVALALLVFGVAYAHHTPEHKLGYPGFIVGKTHLYDVTFNMTSGVRGMDPQVSKAVIQAQVKIYANSKSELYVMMDRVKVSHSLPGVGSMIDTIPLTPDPKLEEHLKEPIIATLEKGMIKSYTLSKRETLESKKIKKALLRNLEVYIDRKFLTDDQKTFWPLTYNITRSSVGGNYSSHYVVTSSPYADFPKNTNVFNVSRTDNFEVIPYLAYKTHHNFVKQGCPEVCKKNHTENKYDAGCPIEHEPYQTPLKRSFVQHHNLRILQQSKVLIIDSVRTKETHVADVYDQNMEITIKTYLRFLKATGDKIPQPTDQETYTDLNDLSKEINEEEIEQLCDYPDTTAAIKEVESLLDEVTDIIIKADLKDDKSKEVGGLLVTLQKALQILKQGDLRTVQKTITDYDDLDQASEKDKIKRQIWLDLLPVIGTSESVSFIVHLITENMNKPNKAISLWESKTILESLPQNIHRPSETTITELSRLLELITDPSTPGYSVFYSAAHLTVARVIRELCSVPTGIEESDDSYDERRGFRYLQRNLKTRKSDDDNEFKNNMARECPKTVVKTFIDKISHELHATEDKAKRVIYIETLARTGLEIVLPELRPYIYGDYYPIGPLHLKRPLSPSYIDYLKTVTIYALHNIVEKSPRSVQEVVLPVFLNKTEPPKVRTAAFSVVIKAQPTLGLLQHIAELSWTEPSEEVGSYVISTLETFGNSSLPCHQLTALRIKKVLPQVKKVDRGEQKAKNILWDLWDQVRGFGFEKRFEFTPSNESFIPSVLYGSLGYNADTLKDYFFQYAFNVQGLTSRTVYDAILERFGLKPAEDIPKEHESTIFSDLDVTPRDNEFWRFTSYEKHFYESSYYYFDEEDTTHKDIITMILDQLKHYITRDAEGKYHGHLIKVYIPSSYHAKTISQSLPYPVQFEMKNPVLVSLKLKAEQASDESSMGLKLHLTPNVYHSIIYINEMLNLGDCKKVGVYHEQKVVLTYPALLTVRVHNYGNVSFSYRFPELPKQIFTYRSEAGTYAGKHVFALLPPNEDRRTIKTIPEQFVRRITYGIIGLPRFDGKIKTEDIQSGMEETPRTPEEAALLFVRRYLNAGWRRKSIDISRIPDSALWLPDTEVQVHVNYTRRYVSYEKPVTDWTEDLKFDDDLDKGDASTYSSEAQKIYKKLSTTLNHIRDDLTVRVEQTYHSSKPSKTAQLFINYYHTLGGFLHLVHINGSAPLPNGPSRFSVSADYAIAFARRPNEFKYTNENYGKQHGLSYGAIALQESYPFRNPIVIVKSVFGYKPLDKVLRLDKSVDPTHFEPETAEICLKDNTKGESDSVACLKAKREKSIYNWLKLRAIWTKELPTSVHEIVDKVDLALKHTFYSHMEFTRKPISKSLLKQFLIELTYINKMTDEPVVDIVLDKPTETVKFWRVSTGHLQPVNSIDTLLETYAAHWTNNTYPATCSMMDKYIRTFDLKSYPLPKDEQECSYVLSTHCTKYKKFAIIVKYNPSTPGTPEVHIYVGKDEIILVPGQKYSYKITYNGQQQTVNVLAPLMLSDTELITALINVANDGTSFIEIHARKAGVKVRYEGSNVKVQVHPRYKGELCGLCSEFNGEVIREYRGVNRCLYTSPFDFAKSSALNSCFGSPFQPVYPYICSDEEITYSQGKQRQHHESEEVEGHEPTLRRNVVSSQGSRICFSIKPVPVCEGSAKPLKTESQEVEFHCLPKQDTNARKMVTESRRRILGELETKSVDHSEIIQVAKMC